MSDKNFVVYKSSAGSGKTFTLVKEYLKLILNQNDPSYYKKILAITFTNKAATEMKDRVMTTLQQFSGNHLLKESALTMMSKICEDLKTGEQGIRKKSDAIFKNMLHNYSDIGISTIDKFTYKIIRTFAFDLKIPVNFELQLEEDEFTAHAVDTLINLAGKDEQITRVLVEFTEQNVEEDKNTRIEKDILQFAKQLMSEGSMEYLQRLSGFSTVDFLRFKNNILTVIKNFEVEVQNLGAIGWKKITDAGITHQDFHQKEKGVGKYFERIKNGGLDKLEPNNYQASAFNQDKWYGSNISSEKKSAIDRIKNELIAVYVQINKLKEKDYLTYHTLKVLDKNLYALSLVNLLQKEVEEYKKENNVLHISEFNKKISETIVNEPAPFIYERLGEKYKHFLIDEFQDTSLLQFMNLLPLIDNSLSEGNFTMLVGDAKQSIYRWRGGESEQFVNLPAIKNHNKNPLLAEREDTLKRNYVGKNLNQNFRSRSEIVAFNNRFFSYCSHTLNDEHKANYEGLEQEFKTDNTGGLVLMEFVPETEKENYKKFSIEKTLEWIDSLQQDGYSLGDVVILTRNNKEGSLLAAELIARRVPVVSSESLLLSKSEEVNFIIAWIDLLYKSKNKIALSQIVNYLHSHSVLEYPSIHHAFTDNSHTRILIKNLDDKGIRLSLTQLLQLNIYELCETIIHLFQLNKIADPYVLFFMDALWSFTGKQNQGIKDVLIWWEERKNKLSLSFPEGLDAVRIMTIHKSKGLEFPAVIIPFANWRNTDPPKNMWVDVNQDVVSDLKCAVVNKTKKLEGSEYENRLLDEIDKEKLDHLNMMYVAFTRPSERLYILNTMPSNFNRISEYSLGFLKNENVWQEGKTSYTFGNKVEHQSIEKEKSTGVTISSFYSDTAFKNISIANQLALNNEDKVIKKAITGKIIHEILSQKEIEKSAEKIINRYYNEGWIEINEITKLKDKIQKIVNHPDISPFLNQKAEVLNEREILLENGEVVRPDRLIIEEGKVRIVDFKTGMPDPKHHLQLKKYEIAIHQLGFSETEKYLIYTETLKVEKV